VIAMMKNPPWDQRIARVLVRPLARTPVTPNQVTVFTLAVALLGAGLLATGDATLANWGAGAFVLARFLDHFDGELARQKNMKSRLGYYLDYAAGGVGYAALFLGIGIGLRDGALGPWAIALGLAGAASALLSMVLNLSIDKAAELDDGQAIGYPGVAGFELEDGIYLLAPITWLGWLAPFFALAGSGAAVYCLWTLARLIRLRWRASRS
jgi:phosphatidylglycerophosphate synthase